MIKRVSFVLTLLVFCAQAAFASVIVLKNGDQITADILEDGEGFLRIKSEFLGEISINKASVDAVLTKEESLSKKVQETEVKAELEAEQEAKEEVHVKAKVWQNKIAAGYNMTNGNTKTTAANITWDASYKKDREDWTLKSAFDYAADKGKMTTQKFFSKAQSATRFAKNPKWFNSRSFELNHDKFARVDYRLLPAVGIGYWFWEKDNSKFEADLAIGYEYTNYNTTDTKATGNFSLIPHIYYDRVLIGKTKFTQDLTFYPSLESFADYRLRSESSLVNPLSDALSLKVSFIDEYNSAPKSDAKKNDTRLITAVEYAF